MKFGRIDYLNLLPFFVFIKKNIKSSRVKHSIDYKKSYPSNINQKFIKGEVNGAFISSILSDKKKFNCQDLGIIAKKKVLSVLVDKSQKGDDIESATSNILAKVLKIDGKIIIGDKALKLYLQNPTKYIDLAKEWQNRTNLPFVFARLCFNKRLPEFRKITDRFIKNRIKIPYYLLEIYSKNRQIAKKDILEYLKLISYKLDNKSKKSLKLFLKKAKECKK